MIIVFTGTLQMWLLVQSQNIASQPWWESSALQGSSRCKQEVTAASKVSAELWAFEEKVLTDSVFPEICGTHAYISCPYIVLRCSGTWFPSTGKVYVLSGQGRFPPTSCTLEAAATYMLKGGKLHDVTSVDVQSKYTESQAYSSLPPSILSAIGWNVVCCVLVHNLF